MVATVLSRMSYVKRLSAVGFSHRMWICYLLAFAIVPSVAVFAADIQVVKPQNASIAGPYSPGILANGVLYVSGQGSAGADGKMQASFDGQMSQALENVKSVLAARGLSLENVVYAHVYLKDMANYEPMNRLWKEAFTRNPPARAVLGVYELPGDGLIEITAVALQDLSKRSIVTVPGFPESSISPAVIAGNKVYLSGFLGLDSAGKVPTDEKSEIELAFEQMKKTLAAAGLDYRHVAFVNPYETAKVTNVMNEVYATHFEFGNTPARATIRVNSLPRGANIEFTGVAVTNLSKRKAIRPKNMPPSPTASPCVRADDTFYCSAKSAFIPGPGRGIYASNVGEQVRMTMRNLLDGLEETGLSFSNVVATNVYLDDMKEFPQMNRVYAQYFPKLLPTRTTVAQVAPFQDRGPKEDVYPTLEQISLIAVR
jgi:reactive intermediate/imine deaminase